MFLQVFFVIIVLFLNSPVSFAAQKPAEQLVLVDELLFDLNGEGVTRYDLRVFEEVVKEMQGSFSSVIIKSFQNNAEFFVFSSLALREAEQLDIQADKEKVARFLESFRFPEDNKKNEDLRQQIKNLFRVAELVMIKERQLQNRQAVITWLVVLKRKYSLGWKSNDFKNRVGFGI